MIIANSESLVASEAALENVALYIQLTTALGFTLNLSNQKMEQPLQQLFEEPSAGILTFLL